ncbi:MAG: GTP-binding protein [Parcubacteria group bacterium Gr01-1014_18]|nr:MAG: GTP-binding protein [Parcubacteria group bacterium Greene0416_36]TSC81284.1 MAG: GTP-binding protein [Parcubacteria group bacterium Gr01-1014_18]TSC99306.1 MAG: GTP-binding protein [Parcubacteria group bacterium Greene1014_20]TSD06857.1 MAG: GTP-binding protein [Parcubacteria group bacterium Greene0714_2]
MDSLKRPIELKHDLYQVSIIGRTNVGKSTLFNRLVEKDKAIVSPIPGTTRDPNVDVCHWDQYQFQLVDTAGIRNLKFADKNEIEENVQKQIEVVFKKTDVFIFVVDIDTGPVPEDYEIVKKLRRLGKPFLIVANKADSPKKKKELASFYSLGGNHTFAVSARNGTGSAEMLSDLVEILSKLGQKHSVLPKPDFTIAILGKPNVGKSTLLNSLLGYSRVIVSEIPHTTREPQDTLVSYSGKTIKILDTAGIRRKYKYKGDSIEKQSVIKTLDTVERAEIVFFMIDASLPIDHQDQKILGQYRTLYNSVVILVNKWDKIPDKTLDTVNDYMKIIRSYFDSIPWAPVIFLSAQSGEKVDQIMDMALRIHSERNRTVPQEILDDIVGRIKAKHGIRKKDSLIPYIYGIRQTQTNPPTFELTTDKKEEIPKAINNIIMKKIREENEFFGTPLLLDFKNIEQ